jgi:hypothetical protein
VVIASLIVHTERNKRTASSRSIQFNSHDDQIEP